jgi:tetratricopeptide (TPR) repeat protein
VRRPVPGIRWAAAILLLLLAVSLRVYFTCGFILGDDAEEFHLIRSMVERGPDLAPPQAHLKYRLPLWMFNYASQSVLGTHEASFFLPSWLLSSLLPVLAFGVVSSLGYASSGALFAGLFVAVAPFEVLVGSLRVNDLFVEFFVALGLYGFVRWRSRPVYQGCAVGAALFLAFYAKLWAAFFYPVLGLYYLDRLRRAREHEGLLAFASTSLVAHGSAAVFFKLATGNWLPFLHHLSATYPVAPERLLEVLLAYPRHLFVGSEHGTTLFGLVPYLLVAGLSAKAARPWLRRAWPAAPRLDGADQWLLLTYLGFFLLLNFFPNSFQFDRYYSVPRIFRYLAPLSFLLTLHTAKLLVDLGRGLPRPVRGAGALVLIGLLIGSDLEATRPGRAQRRLVRAVRIELARACPPEVVLERWQGFFFQALYLSEACPETQVRTPPEPFGARGHEAWLAEAQPHLADGAVLVSGLLPFVYYACEDCAFRLSGFEQPLDRRWRLLSELGTSPFDAAAEPVRLWRWQTGATSAARRTDTATVPELGARQLFDRGIEHFDAGEYARTRGYMAAIRERFPESARSADAAYFFAVTFWREQDCRRMLPAFEELVRDTPHSPWVAAAHYHIGLCLKQQGRTRAARNAFEEARRRAAAGDPVAGYASDALDALAAQAPIDGLGRQLSRLVDGYRDAVDRVLPAGW